METREAELRGFIDSQTVVNTHCHHLDEGEFDGFNLDKLLEKSYVSWAGVPVGDTRESREAYLRKVRSKSYFVWLGKGLKDLYGFEGPLTADNWGELDAMIRDAHRNRGRHLSILREKCGYRRIVLDAYWNPGSDHGLPELFAPTYRINMFLYGYSREARDHNGNNPLLLYGKKCEGIDEYASFMREVVAGKKRGGCVALKSALAYDRNLVFEETGRDEANEVFRRKKGGPSGEDVRRFQDYVFHELCAIAEETGLPFQCHTGLGELDRTNAIRLRNVIAKFPKVRFVLFHGGYPWCDDLLALLHRFENVYADICWLPIISPTAAERTLHELIEVGTADKVMWGCDTWTSEESYGALIAFREVLARVLAGKLREGYLGPEDARALAAAIANGNAAGLFGI